MPRRETIVVPAVVMLIFSGCAQKPRAGAERPDDLAEEAVSMGKRSETDLTWTRISEQEATRFGAQAIVLGREPSPGVTSPPEVPSGTLHYGALHMGGQEGRDVFVAVLESPEPEEGEEPSPWLLFIDRDLDGDLREERPVPALSRREPGREGGPRGAQFPVVETLGPVGGVHAFLVMAHVGERLAILQAHTACALRGKVRIFGEEHDVTLYDSDANGVFGDSAELVGRGGDAVWIDFDGNGERSPDETLAFAPRLIHEGKVAAVEVSARERRLAVTELDVPFGEIARSGAEPSEKLSVQLYSDEYRLIAPGPARRIPAGEFMLLRYAVERGAAGGKTWILAGGWLPASAPKVRVREGEVSELAFGPPLETRAWVRYDAAPAESDAALILVTLRGGAGENVRVGVEGEPTGWGEFRVLDGERVVGSGRLEQMMPGAGGVVWAPAEEIEKGTRLAFEVSPELGPFADGFLGRTEFEYGRSTPIRLVISEVDADSQAERAGLKPGDLILRYDSKPVEGPVEFMRAMREAAGRKRVELVVLRDGTERAFALLPGKIGIQTLLSLP